jgi:hypothetical protein
MRETTAASPERRSWELESSDSGAPSSSGAGEKAARAMTLRFHMGSAEQRDGHSAVRCRQPDMTTTCSTCGTENREGRRFCAECGGALAAPTCPACGAANAAGERFCGDCGAPLAAMASSAGSAPSNTETVGDEGERKQLTVLFADVQGSMELQESLDAEGWARIIGRLAQILAEGVRRFGGTVEQFTGDGIMALFGAPLAQEDHARRASHAAWHVIEAIASYAKNCAGTRTSTSRSVLGSIPAR